MTIIIVYFFGNRCIIFLSDPERNVNMQIKRIMLMPGVYFTGITTDKFKTSCLSLNLLRPLRNEEASLNALLPDVQIGRAHV